MLPNFMTGVVLHIVSTRVPHMHLAIFSYKRVFGVDMGFIFVITVFKNYFIYLFLSLLFTVGENFIVSVIVDK